MRSWIDHGEKVAYNKNKLDQKNLESSDRPPGFKLTQYSDTNMINN